MTERCVISVTECSRLRHPTPAGVAKQHGSFYAKIVFREAIIANTLVVYSRKQHLVGINIRVAGRQKLWVRQSGAGFLVLLNRVPEDRNFGHCARGAAPAWSWAIVGGSFFLLAAACARCNFTWANFPFPPSRSLISFDFRKLPHHQHCLSCFSIESISNTMTCVHSESTLIIAAFDMMPWIASRQMQLER